VADVTIRFRHDKKTGKNEIVIGYESEDDALPHEHERDHRGWAEQLLGRKLDEGEELIVERVTKRGGTLAPERETEPTAARAAEKEKG
jgi:hypothetical protein